MIETVWCICMAYGLATLIWLFDYGRRLHRKASRDEMRRALAGGLVIYLAFIGSTHALLFWQAMS